MLTRAARRGVLRASRRQALRIGSTGARRHMATATTAIAGGSATAFLLGALSATGAWYLMGPQTGGEVDYKAVREDIIEAMEDLDYDDGSYGPVFVRLAWHACGTYSKADDTGGSGGGATMRFKPEKDHGGNAGLEVARDRLEPIKQKYPALSYADLWSLAGVVAIEEMGGPKIPWRPGRKDAQDERSCTPDGRLPDADKTKNHLQYIFQRMGFTDQEIVALSGAHCLGRCHSDRSGFEGPWTNSPTTFSNAFYTELLGNTWQPKMWTGPAQFEDAATGQLMMLPSDYCLKTDPAFRKYVEKYASDEKAFFEDFAKAYQKLSELGCKDLQDPIKF